MTKKRKNELEHSKARLLSDNAQPPQAKVTAETFDNKGGRGKPSQRTRLHGPTKVPVRAHEKHAQLADAKTKKKKTVNHLFIPAGGSGLPVPPVAVHGRVQLLRRRGGVFSAPPPPLAPSALAARLFSCRTLLLIGTLREKSRGKKTQAWWL